MAMTQFLKLLLVFYISESTLSLCPNDVIQQCSCANNQSDVYSISCDFRNSSVPDSLISNITIATVHVKDLDLSYSYLSEFPQHFLSGISTVDDLKVDHNLLESIPQFLTKVKLVNRLDLSHNRISHLRTDQDREKDEANESKYNILILILAYNRLESLDSVDLKRFPYLTSLDVSNNKLTEVDVKVYLPSLISADFSGNEIVEFRNLDLGSETKLNFLNLSANFVRNIQWKALLSLKLLKEIDLSRNQHTLRASGLTFPNHIARVDLSSCHLNTIDVCGFLQLHDLRYLDLNDNDVICSCEFVWLHRHVTQNAKSAGMLGLVLGQSVGILGECYDVARKVHVPFSDLKLNCSKEMYDSYVASCQPQSLKEEFRNLKEYVQKLQLNVSIEGKVISALWTPSTSPLIYGFMVHVHELEKDSSYDSSILHPSVYSFSNTEHEVCCGTYSICLWVLLNETYVYHRVCTTYVEENTKFVIGILVGFLFLTPCVIVLTCVMIKDRKQAERKKILSRKDSKYCAKPHVKKAPDPCNVTPIIDIIRDHSSPVMYYKNDMGSNGPYHCHLQIPGQSYTPGTLTPGTCTPLTYSPQRQLRLNKSNERFQFIDDDGASSMQNVDMGLENPVFFSERL